MNPMTNDGEHPEVARLKAQMSRLETALASAIEEGMHLKLAIESWKREEADWVARELAYQNVLHMAQRVLGAIEKADLKDDNLLAAADFNELETAINAALKG